MKVVNDLKWLVVICVAMVGLLGGAAIAQDTGASKSVIPAGTVRLPDDKKLPPEVAIPEIRQDKAKVLVLERALIQQQMEKLQAQYKELKAAEEDKTAKLMAEFTSAAKAAGVDEGSLDKYEFRLDLLKMLLKKEEPKAEVKK